MAIAKLNKNLLNSFHFSASSLRLPFKLQLHSIPMQAFGTFQCIGHVNKTPSFSHFRFRQGLLQGYSQQRCYAHVQSRIPSRSRPFTLLSGSSRMSHIDCSYSGRKYFSQPAAEDEIRSRLRVKPFHNRMRRHDKPVVEAIKKADINIEEPINGVAVDSLTSKSKSKVKKSTITGTDESKIKEKPESVNIKPAGARKKKDSNIEGYVNGVTVEGSTSPSVNRSKKKEEKPSKQGKTKDEISNTATVKQLLSERPPEQQYYSVGKSIQNGQLVKLYPPSGKSVVVVESVTKAKVIQKYLGDMYEVLPSYGHVRDLAARSGSVRPDDDFSMLWEVPSAAWTHLKSIKVALNGATNLILASDPDREGEAIAWHIIEMLLQQNAVHDGIMVARVVFHEITETSIKKSLELPRDIDINLVNAYLGRRALDYLIGFNISPILWRKLPGCPSAGRVQSAALSLMCDREMEIDQFKPQEYWTVDAIFSNNNSKSSKNDIYIQSHLTQVDSKRLGQLSISSEKEAKDIEQELKSSAFKVLSSKKGQTRKNPTAPFITSTLQQESANKLHFPATYTMKLAQKLYEGIQLPDGSSSGLITYTRTDGFHISDEAVIDIHTLVTKR